MSKIKLKIKEINLNDFLFPAIKMLIILIPIVILFLSLSFVYKIFNEIYDIAPAAKKQPFFDLEKLKTVGPKWGIDISGLK